ncbi:myrosinase 1-like isoform X1 [Colias croceus]|uniref:myrosinase 1-like isoform X1 n=1 Tax=Colias crocea TaxID=72248 RepID=UPI001E27F6B4|nr:myrosinase 1-like isoform X1 [Colias croceus]
MFYLKIVVLCVLVVLAGAERRFPDGFKFGAATAAYQVEGAWNVSDKSPSVWDIFTHDQPHAIADGSSGDVACDSYNKWREDIELAAELGLHFYRLSISWPRLLPNGFTNIISEDGTRYYNDLIDGLLEKGIEPVVTLYHWDLPQNLQDLGGWTNPLIVGWFKDYARIVYTLFGDRVKTWITINEPIVICEVVYTMGTFAPGISSPGIGNYLCGKNILMAHAAAWRVYDEEFKPKYHGKVSLTNQIFWMEPYSEEFIEEAEFTMQYAAGFYSHAIYTKEGGWPPTFEKYIAEKSKREGYPRSRLPPFTEEEKEFVKGTHDFYAVNHYTSRLARSLQPGETAGLWPMFGAGEIDVFLDVHPDWPQAANSWFFVNPPGLRKLLVWLKKNYGDLEYMIIENGYSTREGDINDSKRIQYYQDHLEQVLLAIQDGVNVTRYTAWTLFDNFEWTDGYTSKFGLIDVDFNDPSRKRTLRNSARFYANIIKTHSLDDINTINKI